MHKLRAGLLALLCLGAAAGCTTNTSPGDIKFGPVSLQLAVGTLNDSAGTISSLNAGPGPGTRLNAVSTFRGQFGASAFLNPGTGVLTGPGGLSFTAGGLFSYGQAPGTNGVTGQPPTYTPASTVGGYATGFIYTAAPPTAGGYTISTSVPVNGGMQAYSANATLPASPTVLGAYAPPVYASGGATGGGTFTVVVPTGVTETLIVISQAGTEVATIETKGTTAVLPAGTLTLGTAYTDFAIGADYPFVEAGPPASTSISPTIVSAGGTADLTVSSSAAFTQ